MDEGARTAPAVGRPIADVQGFVSAVPAATTAAGT